MKRDANEVVAIVRDMTAKDPDLLASVTSAYNRICDKIEARAKAKRPLPLGFEVRHECAAARLSLLSAIADGEGVAKAEALAASSIGLEA